MTQDNETAPSQQAAPEIVEAVACRWRYRYADDRASNWTHRGGVLEPKPATDGLAAIEVEPLYLATLSQQTNQPSADVVEQIAQFIEAWNGDTRIGDTFCIAYEIRNRFASLTTPTEASEPPAAPEQIAENANCSPADDDAVERVFNVIWPECEWSEEPICREVAVKAAPAALSATHQGDAVNLLREAQGHLDAISQNGSFPGAGNLAARIDAAIRKEPEASEARP